MSAEHDWRADACQSCGGISGHHFMGCSRGPAVSIAGPIRPVWRGLGLEAAASPGHGSRSPKAAVSKPQPLFGNEVERSVVRLRTLLGMVEAAAAAEPDDLDSPAGAGWEVEADRG